MPKNKDIEKEEIKKEEIKETVQTKEQKKQKTITIKKSTLQTIAMVIVAFVVGVAIGSFTMTPTGATIGTTTTTTITPTTTTITLSAAQMKSLEDDDPFLGPANAKVTVIEFSDYECPYCGAAEGTYPALINQFKSQDPSWEAAVPKLRELAEHGKVKFVYRDFPLSSHRNAESAAIATECADEQGKFWEMHDKIYENQQTLSIENFKLWATEIGLNAAQFSTCLDGSKYRAEVRKDLADGSSVGVGGTPTFFVNGIKIVGAYPFSAFQEIIEAALAE